MENNKSTKRYRGFKYIVLLLLLVAALGFTFFTSHRPFNRGTEANSIKEAVNDTLAKGRDKVALASGISEETTPTVESATDTGNERVDNKKTGSGVDAGQDPGGYAFEEQPPQGAAGVLPEGTPQAEGVVEDAPGATTGADESQAYNDLKTLPTATIEDKASSEIESATPSMAEKIAGHQRAVNDEKVQPEKTTGPPLRCVGPPPRGEDLGNRYIVASCETLSIISQRTGVEFNKLRDHNPQVKNPDLIYPNQELQLPPRG